MPLVNMHFSTPVAVGAKVTVEEIKRENVNLQLCQHCADLIERSESFHNQWANKPSVEVHGELY